MSAGAPAALRLDDVAIRFGGVQAVDGVTVAVAPGDFVGLIGPNGAGKTTLIRIVAGQLRPDRGRVMLGGVDVTADPTATRVRNGLALTHQIVRPFRAMTVLDNVVLGAGYRRTASPWRAMLHVDRRRETERAAAILAQVGLAGREGKLAGALPLGQMKRLEVARALALDPQVILLDEPLAGLNHAEAARQVETIAAVNARGITVVLVEHNLEAVMRNVRRLIVLDNGRVIGDGAPAAVMADPIVSDAYVGSGERMLKLDHLNCGYGSVEAVHDVSFAVPAGSVFALLGPNGAGKTSTMMAIMGHVDIHAGRILLEDVDITRRCAVDRVDLGIALVPEGRQLFSDLTVDENLTVGGYARPAVRDLAKRDRVFGYFPRLHDRRRQLAGSLSGGEQQMLAIGRALMAEPRLLLVDELSLGLMPKMVDLCLDTLMALKRDGLTIVLIEQNTARALDVADQVCVLSSGVQVFHGTVDQARSAGSLFAAFLGVSDQPQS